MNVSTEKQISFHSWQQHSTKKNLTVYVTRQSKEIALRGKSLLIRPKQEDGPQIEYPLMQVRRVVFVGRPRCSHDFIYTCMRKVIHVDFLDVFGRPVGLAMPLEDSKECMQKYQYMSSCAQESLGLAQEIVCAKIGNFARILNRRSSVDMQEKNWSFRALQAQTLAELRGVEGAAARMYFSAFATLTQHLGFTHRQARPAPDPVNMLLSFGYGMLHNRLASALQSCGLNARLGFYHQGRGSHYALASDLMEDIRFVVDKTVLRLIGRKQLQEKDFIFKLGRWTFAHNTAFKAFLTVFEENMGKFFPAPCARPGINQGDMVNLNTWLDASALAYGAWLRHKRAYVALRVA